jgi:hypothetical protein
MFIYDPQSDGLSLDAPDIGVHASENFLTALFWAYTQLVTKVPSVALFIWTYGFWTLLLFFTALFVILKKEYIRLFAFLPVFVHIAVLVLTAPGNYEFRYGIPVILIGLLMPFLILFGEGKTVITRKGVSYDDGRKRG